MMMIRTVYASYCGQICFHTGYILENDKNGDGVDGDGDHDEGDEEEENSECFLLWADQL